MSFKQLFISVTLVSLFLLAMINFGVNLADENNANNSITDNAEIGSTLSKLEANLSGFETISEGQRKNFESDLPIAGIGELIIFSLIGAGKVFTSSIIGLFNILFFPLSSVIGLSNTVIGVFMSILLITIILATWRLIKAGE